MKRVFIGYVICLLFLNCAKKEEKIAESNIPYIISKENQKFLKELQISKIPPPLPGFYGYNQIIIDKNNNFYYYQKETIAWHCIPSKSDTIPDFINLKPKEIIKIPNYSIIDFINKNISNKDERHTMLVIASQNDTIDNKDFKKVLDFLSNQSKSKLKIFTVRKSTQEEDTVIKYKKSNQPYDSDNIKWDESKIKFLKFSVPVKNRK